MKKALINRKLVLAEKARQAMNCYCEDLQELLQPYFLDKIYIEFREGDSFVVVVDIEGAPNISVTDAVKNCKKDDQYYFDRDY